MTDKKTKEIFSKNAIEYIRKTEKESKPLLYQI